MILATHLRRCCVAGLLVLCVAASANAQQPAPPSTAMTSACQFNTGPRTGQLRDVAALTGIGPFAVGGPCADGAGSTGTAVAEAAPLPATPAPPPPGGLTLACRLTAGPRVGQTEVFMAGAVPPFPLGNVCNDGRGSTGIGVP